MKKDSARKATESKLYHMEQKLSKIYAQSQKEMSEKWDAYMKRSVSKIEGLQNDYNAILNSGTSEEIKAAKEKLETAKMNQTLRNSYYKSMVDETTKRIANVNEIALKYTNGEMAGIYAMNYNAVSGQAKEIGGISFNLVNEATVKNLAKNNPHLIPYKNLNRKKDYLYNKKKINSSILQGILQGESINKIAKRLTPILDGNRKSAIRNARTMVTGAENKGRLDSYKDLEKQGVILEKVWMATADDRTRPSHSDLDGSSVPVDKEFDNGCMYPGDSNGPADEVWQCRCSMGTNIVGFKGMNGKINYVETEKSGIVNGKDISESFERRLDAYSHEIEDVINKQGFDGKPRIVSEEEFYKAVEESNFIAQRTYSAPSQEILDAYREQLYNGDWYVDCSVGGAQYGQGMYCAADYNGTITKGMQDEMKHYQKLGSERIGEISKENLSIVAEDRKNRANEVLSKYKSGEISKEAGLSEYRRINSMNPNEYMATYMKDSKIEGARSYTETMTLDPSAKIGKYDDLRKEMLRSNTEDTDVGVFAAKRGYDAINAEGHGESGSYTVILNRTKLIIKEP